MVKGEVSNRSLTEVTSGFKSWIGKVKMNLTTSRFTVIFPYIIIIKIILFKKKNRGTKLATFLYLNLTYFCWKHEEVSASCVTKLLVKSYSFCW